MKSPSKKTILLVLSGLIGVIGVAQGLHWTDIVSGSTAATITGALGFAAMILHAIETDETGGGSKVQASPLASLLALGALVALLSGCASTTGAPGSNWATGIAGGLNNFFVGVNAIKATMQTPDGQSAIASLKAVYRGTVCGVAATSGFVKQIAVDVNATKTVNDTAIVMAVSGTVCKAAGGVVGS